MDDDENIIFYGTPLPELDDDVVIRKKANQDLTVRDEKGRQRFHGAFTGGFSAGYFNTVGTKEGWEPTNFVSSRSNKASTSSSQQNPEDFMDDEDFGEFGIAPKKIHTTTNFRDSNESSVRKRSYVSNDEVIPGEAPLKDLVRPVTESIGIRILKELGWRHGQGIGPRVTKKSETPTKVYGCSLGPLTEEASSEVPSAITFAPDDVPGVPYIPKDNFHGIGYSGLSTQSVLSVPLNEEFSLSKTKSWLAKDKKKIAIRGQAFGVGAFEDEDDDIYHKDDMSQYDFSEFLGTKTDSSSRGSKHSSADNYGSVIKVLEGFALSTQPSSNQKYYPAPEVPKNFVPVHQKSLLNITLQPSGSSNVKQKLGHVVRSIMLGEKPSIPSEVCKIPKLTSARKSRFDIGPSGLPTPSPFMGASGFKPFSVDGAKQQRYENFVKMGCNKVFLETLQSSSMTEWERHQEIDEFSKAAVLYQPLSRALESRFESKSHLSVELNLSLSEIKKNEPDSSQSKTQEDDRSHREVFEWHPVALLCKRFNVPNPYPDSKFEGIPNLEKTKKPSLFDNIFPEDVKQSKFSSPKDLLQDISADSVQSFPKDSNDVSMSDSSQFNNEELEAAAPSTSISENVDIVSASTLVEDVPKNSKPSMDLFKEIFQTSSSEDSESDKEVEKPKSSEMQSSKETENFNATHTSDISSLKNTSVPNTSIAASASEKKAFGVFANIDLDALNRRTSLKSVDKSSEPCSLEIKDRLTNQSSSDLKKSPIPQHIEVIDLCNSDEKGTPGEGSNVTNEIKDLFYGPAPPPPNYVSPSSTCSKPYKHLKHKHKHKKEKKKKKRKKKKHTKKESDDSSIESEEDIPASRILEKLKALKNLGKR